LSVMVLAIWAIWGGSATRRGCLSLPLLDARPRRSLTRPQ
jgi:hypothetical protein